MIIADADMTILILGSMSCLVLLTRLQIRVVLLHTEEVSYRLLERSVHGEEGVGKL